MCKEKWPEVRLYINIWAEVDDLTGWSQAWKYKEVWRRGIWMELYVERQRVKIFMSHIDAHQILPTTEKAFSNQVEERGSQLNQPASGHSIAGVMGS